MSYALGKTRYLHDRPNLSGSMKGGAIRVTRVGGFGRMATSARSSTAPSPKPRKLIAGCSVIKAESPEEALEWSRRFPNPAGRGRAAQIEIRRLFELDDFEQAEAIDRFRKMEADQKK